MVSRGKVRGRKGRAASVKWIKLTVIRNTPSLLDAHWTPLNTIIKGVNHKNKHYAKRSKRIGDANGKGIIHVKLK